MNQKKKGVKSVSSGDKKRSGYEKNLTGHNKALIL